MSELRRREFLKAAGLSATALLWGSRTISAPAENRWSQDRAASWYQGQPWPVGCNYLPAYAVNELEMWQANTYHPDAIARELDWAAGLGMNALRVFLHNLVWREEGDAFLRRVESFLAIAAERRMKVLFVLFDSCWDPFPHPGPQPAPRPGVHNSRWVQSPGAAALDDPTQWPQLKSYVTAIVSAFRSDPRVLGWDLWNEPDNLNVGSYEEQEPQDKLARVGQLLPQVFEWARDASPQQPLTSGLWQGHWADLDRVSPIARIQLTQSDILSFHCYEPAYAFAARVAELRPYGRPIFCTEYMARPLGSTVETILPLAKRDKVAAFNWGLVAGRSQTTFPWELLGAPLPVPAERRVVPRPVPYRWRALQPAGSRRISSRDRGRRAPGETTLNSVRRRRARTLRPATATCGRRRRCAA